MTLVSRVGAGLKARGLTGYALAAIAATFWATGALTAKWIFSRFEAFYGVSVPATVLSAARATTAFLILLAVLVVRDRASLRVRTRDLPFLAVFGIFGMAMVHFSYFKTISLTNVATAILLEYLAPVLVLAVSVLFLGERFSWSLPSAVTLSIAGCALMVGAVGGKGLVVSREGLAWGLGSAVFFALYTIMGKYAVRNFSPWTLLTWGLGFATVFWIVVLRGPAEIVALMRLPLGMLAAVYLAIFATIVPFGAFLKALHYIDATKASVTATLEPAIAGVAAFLLFGERLTLPQLLGGFLVLVAVVIVQWPGLVPEELPPAM